jgi:hypothetical protein
MAWALLDTLLEQKEVRSGSTEPGRDRHDRPATAVEAP